MRAYVIPIALSEAADRRCAVAFLQRKDHLLGPQLCDMLLAIGGKVEHGETPQQAALRELHEEVPGWLPDAPELEPLYDDAEITVFVTPADAGLRSTRAFVRATTEGMPAVLSRHAVAVLAEDRWVYPQIKAPLLERLLRLESAPA